MKQNLKFAPFIEVDSIRFSTFVNSLDEIFDYYSAFVGKQFLLNNVNYTVLEIENLKPVSILNNNTGKILINMKNIIIKL